MPLVCQSTLKKATLKKTYPLFPFYTRSFLFSGGYRKGTLIWYFVSVFALLQASEWMHQCNTSIYSLKNKKTKKDWHQTLEIKNGITLPSLEEEGEGGGGKREWTSLHPCTKIFNIFRTTRLWIASLNFALSEKTFSGKIRVPKFEAWGIINGLFFLCHNKSNDPFSLKKVPLPLISHFPDTVWS